MAGVGDGELDKAAPMDAVQDDVGPASAEHELHRLVVTRMKNTPGMSYARAFTHEYLAPENRSLKARVSSEGILRMQAMAPTKPFPRYSAPGQHGASNVGRSGRKVYRRVRFCSLRSVAQRGGARRGVAAPTL